MFLYLVRHGQSVGNVKKTFHGQIDYPLIVAHNGSLSLILKRLGLAREEQLFKPGWFFQHGTFSTIRVDETGAELVGFNQ